VQATTHFNDAKLLAEVSAELGDPMVGINIDVLTNQDRLSQRGW
jgi:pyridoxal 5'-phosphate synthase pdxS subunit